MRRTWFWILVAALVAVSCVAQAAQPAASDEMILNAAKGTYDNKTKTWTLTQAVIEHGGERLVADQVLYNKDTKQAIATGHLSFADDENTVIADRMTANFSTRHALFEGHVHLLSIKRPAEAGATPEKTDLTSDRLEYWYRDRRALASGGVRVINEKDEVLTGDQITVNLKDRSMVAQGSVKGRFLIEEKQEPGPPEAAPPEAAPATPAPAEASSEVAPPAEAAPAEAVPPATVPPSEGSPATETPPAETTPPATDQ